jgi:hypothetical protein
MKTLQEELEKTRQRYEDKDLPGSHSHQVNANNWKMSSTGGGGYITQPTTTGVDPSIWTTSNITAAIEETEDISGILVRLLRTLGIEEDQAGELLKLMVDRMALDEEPRKLLLAELKSMGLKTETCPECEMRIQEEDDYLCRECR